MNIHSDTTIQAYQLHKGGTRARMAILRMIAAASVDNRNEATRLQPGDWRGARHYGLHSYTAAYGLLSGSANTEGVRSVPVWVEHHGQSFRNVRATHEVVSTRHHGWFTDSDCQETAFGIVAGLTHGRFIAGYEWSSNGERGYFGQVFTDEEEAAHMADEHARVFAEGAKEDSERFDAMQDAAQVVEDTEKEISDELQRVRELFALRHRNGFSYTRDACRYAIRVIRHTREQLAEEKEEANEAAQRYERG